jgi:glycosyltransferase involved in cell wall biosynthesis
LSFHRDSRMAAVSKRATTACLPSVSVIIPTYGGRHRLECVLSPLLEDPATGEIIVVVDGSTDGSLELLQERATADSRLRPLFIERRGPSAARQVGVEAATNEVVLMLDDDLVAEPGLVSGHARHHATAEGIVVIGYYSHPSESKRRPGSFPDEIYADAYRTSWESYAHDGEQALIHLWGGNVSLRRVDCLHVGVQSDAFYCRGPGHEDQDFGIRCLEFGLRGITDRSLSARHLHYRSVGSFIRDAREDGAGAMLVHILHADVVGPADISRFSVGLPLVARLIVQLSRRRAVERVTAAVLLRSVRVAGWVRMFGLETNLARLLRRIQQQRGALELLASHPRHGSA